MASNYKNYLDYAGLQKFWTEAKKYFNNLIESSTGSIEELKHRIEYVTVTYDGVNDPSVVNIEQGTGTHGSALTLNMSAFAKKADISAALKFQGAATPTELYDLAHPATAESPVPAQGDVYTVVKDQSSDAHEDDFKVGSEYAWDGQNWIELGGTISLDGYVTTADLDIILLNYVQTSTLADYVTSDALQTILAGYTPVTDHQLLAKKVSDLETTVDNIDEVEISEIEALFA